MFQSRSFRGAALALLAAIFMASTVSAVEPPESRTPVADFDLDNMDGDQVSLSDYAGKVVVISFWATWCGPCLQELPFMNGFYEEFGPDDFVVLAITTDGPDTIAEARNIVRRNRWTVPVLFDLDGSVMAQLNPRGTQPFTMFVDAQGRLAHAHEGFSSGDEVAHRETIQTLLAE